MVINIDNILFSVAHANDNIQTGNDTSNISNSLPEDWQKQSDSATSKDFSDFQAKITKQIEDNTSLLGINTGNILAGSIIFELLLIVILFLCFKDNHSRLSKRLAKQNDRIDALTRKIDQLERNVAKQKISAPIINWSAPPKPIAEIQNFNEQRPIEQPPEPPPITAEDKYKNFVKDFNALTNQSGFNLKNSRNEFMRKYDIRTFSCVNVDARMNEPIPNPEFGSANSLASPDYLAYEFESGLFAVVPNVKNYSDNHHTERAMGEVFNSNFVAGNTYNKIRVNKPAIFKGMWNLEKLGELELN